MRSTSHRIITAVALAGLLARPAMATQLSAASTLEDTSPVRADATTRMTAVADRLVELGDAPEAARAATSRLTEDDLAVLAANPGMLRRAGADASGTDRVATHLVALGADAGTAGVQAAMLLPEDIAVLLRNPEMLQRAGAMSETSQALLIGGLLIGGLVVLGASSSSSGFLFIN